MIVSDSIDNNLEVITELLKGQPKPTRDRAKRAAMAMEKTFEALKRDHPKDPAVALGVAFAVFTLGQRMVQDDTRKGDDPGSLIELLN
jgi:hypothetical protein